MFRITPTDALQLIEKERAIVRVLESDPHNYSNLEFEFNQFADPENNRPVRPLLPTADRTQVYNHKLKKFVKRILKRTERGLPQPGNLRIKAVSGTLLPTDGNMRLYNHALINEGHRHVLYGVDAGENPDRYLYLHKTDPKIDVSKEPCLIVKCFTSDAGTNTKWHIKGQPLNDYHKGLYPAAVSFKHLREHNRYFIKNRNSMQRHKHERNEVQFKPSVAALRFIGAVSSGLLDRVNALHFKLFVWEKIKVDLPVFIFDDYDKHLYEEEQQARDILAAFIQGVSYAYDIYERIKNQKEALSGVFLRFCALHIDYVEYSKQLSVSDSGDCLVKFYDFLKTRNINEESKEEKVTSSSGDYSGIQHADAATPFQPNPEYPIASRYAKQNTLSRKLWSEIVAKTEDANAVIDTKAFEQQTIARLKRQWVDGNHEKIYRDMCLYLQETTRIVIGFPAQEIIGKMPVGLHSLNLAEMRALGLKRANETHFQERKLIENKTFEYIPAINTQFETLIGARPHYAFLSLGSWDCPPTILNKDYGESYVILRPVVKFNSLFFPHNIFYTKKQATPCTYFHFGVLLSQASDALFFGLVNAVSGQMSDSRIKENKGYEMHTYFPPINLFDANVVERIYVSPNEHKLIPAERQFIEEKGIHVCPQDPDLVYQKEKLEFRAAAKANDDHKINKILSEFPFLKPSPDFALTSGDFDLYQLLLKRNPQLKPAGWSDIINKVPLNAMHHFFGHLSKAGALTIFQADNWQLFSTFIAGLQSEIDEKTWQVLFGWINQFEAAQVGLGLRYAELLLGYVLNNRNQARLDALLQTGLLTHELNPVTVNNVFRDPKSQTITRFLIQEKHYALQGTAEETSALLAGENYWAIRDPQQFKPLFRHDKGAPFWILRSYFHYAEDQDQVDKIILYLGQTGLLFDLDVGAVVTLAMNTNRYVMSLLTFFAFRLYSGQGVNHYSLHDVYSGVVCKYVSASLIRFLFDLLIQDQNQFYLLDMARKIVPHLLPGPYSLVPEIDCLVRQYQLNDLIEVVDTSNKLTLQEQGVLIPLLKKLLSDKHFNAGRHYFILFSLISKKLHLQNPDVSQIAKAIHALARAIHEGATRFPRHADDLKKCFDSLTLTQKRNVLFELIDHYPFALSDNDINALIIASIREFDFLMSATRAVYSSFTYMQCYFPNFVQSLMEVVTQAPAAWLREAVLYYASHGAPDAAKKMVLKQPSLLEAVDARQRSLLHHVLHSDKRLAPELIESFCESKAASQDDVDGCSSLSLVSNTLMQAEVDRGFPVMKMLLKKVNYTSVQLVNVLREHLHDGAPEVGFLELLCQKINTITISSDELHSAIKLVMSYPQHGLWKIFLNNTALTSDMVNPMLVTFIDACPSEYVDLAVLQLLDRCSDVYVPGTLKGNIGSTKLFLVSLIISHPHCRPDPSFSDWCWLELQHVLTNRAPTFSVLHAVKNFIVTLKKLNRFASEKTLSTFVRDALQCQHPAVAAYLLTEGFDLPDEGKKRIMAEYVTLLTQDQSKLRPEWVSMLALNSNLHLPVWQEIYRKKFDELDVTDYGLKINKIRSYATIFQNDFKLDQTTTLEVNENVRLTTEAILTERCEFNEKLKSALLNYEFQTALLFYNARTIHPECMQELQRIGRRTCISEEKIDDKARLKRLFSGVSIQSQNLTDMIALLGKSNVLLDREAKFIERVNQFLPIYIEELCLSFETAQSGLLVNITVRLMQCYYLLDQLHPPESHEPELLLRKRCRERLTSVHEKLKQPITTVTLLKKVGSFVTPKLERKIQSARPRSAVKGF